MTLRSADCLSSFQKGNIWRDQMLTHFNYLEMGILQKKRGCVSPRIVKTKLRVDKSTLVEGEGFNTAAIRDFFFILCKRFVFFTKRSVANNCWIVHLSEEQAKNSWRSKRRSDTQCSRKWCSNQDHMDTHAHTCSWLPNSHHHMHATLFSH